MTSGADSPAPALAPAAAARGADDPAGASRIRRWLVLLICAYVLSELLPIGRAPIANRAEDRCAEVVYNMLASGDWLVPRFEGGVRLNKPPLAYWCGALVGAASGGYSLVALRLPSLLAGVGLIVLTWAWGRRVGGARVGLAAAAVLASMELVDSYGRRGVAEMQLALWANLALLLFDRLLEEPRPALRILFGLALGLALLAKATAGLMIVAVPAVVILVARRRWREAWRARNLAGLALALAIGLAWYLAILLVVPDGWPLLRTELLLPLGVAEGGGPPSAAHFNPPWFHLDSLLTGATPALLLLPWMVRAAWASRGWRGRPRTRFVLVVFVSLFVAFSALPQKQKHYMLPLLPSLAILLAQGTLDRSARDPAGFARTARWLGASAATIVLLGTGAAAVLEWRRTHEPAVAVGLAALGLSLAPLIAWAARRGPPARIGGACVLAWLALMAAYGLVVEPRQPLARGDVPTAPWNAELPPGLPR